MILSSAYVPYSIPSISLASSKNRPKSTFKPAVSSALVLLKKLKMIRIKLDTLFVDLIYKNDVLK